MSTKLYVRAIVTCDYVNCDEKFEADLQILTADDEIPLLRIDGYSTHSGIEPHEDWEKNSYGCFYCPKHAKPK